MVIEGPPVEEAPPLRRNRDFQLLWTGQAVSELGSAIALLAYPLLVLAGTGSATLAGVVGLVAGAVGLVVRLPAGVAVDRWDRRRTMLAADAARAAAMAGLAAAVVLDAASLGVIVAAAAVESAGHEFLRNAERAAVGNVVPAHQVPSALARNEARVQVATLFGPALGGWLFAAGRALPFGVNAVSYLLSVVALAMVRSRLQQPRQSPPAPWRGDLREGIAWPLRHPLLRVFTVWGAMANLLFGAVTLLVVATLEGRGMSAGAVGTLLALAGGGGVLGALAAAPLARTVAPRILLPAASWLLALAVLGQAFAGPAALVAAGFAATVFCVPPVNTVMGVYQLALTPDELRGRAGSVAMLVSGAFQPFGPLLGGLLYDQAGPRWAFLTIAGLLGLLAAATTVSKQVRSLREPGPAPEPHSTPDR